MFPPICLIFMADKAVYLNSIFTFILTELDDNSTFINNSALYLYAKLLAWFRSVGKNNVSLYVTSLFLG